MNEEEMQKFFNSLKELEKSIEDIPQMARIQEVLNEKVAAMLEDVNSYLIDEREKAKSEITKKSIDDLIANNFAELVKIREVRKGNG